MSSFMDHMNQGHSPRIQHVNDNNDCFERLPESVVLLIFNKLPDVKALGACILVSKRFNALVPQVESMVYMVVDHRRPPKSAHRKCSSGGGSTNWASRFFLSAFQKPLQTLRHYIGQSKKPTTTCSSESSQEHHSPQEVLKNFKHVHHLHIVLPGGELGVGKGELLKWRAEFGATLDNCVLLGASSLEKTTLSSSTNTRRRRNSRVVREELDQEYPIDHQYTNNDDQNKCACCNEIMQLRIIWTISSLIAASARHYLLHQIVCDHPSLESLVITDLDGQGMLSMGKEQLHEYRSSPITDSSTAIKRTQMPALHMKFWYASTLELPNGIVLQEATLIAIQPSNKETNPTDIKNLDATKHSTFDGPFECAINALMKKQTLLLEMNSF